MGFRPLRVDVTRTVWTPTPLGYSMELLGGGKISSDSSDSSPELCTVADHYIKKKNHRIRRQNESVFAAGFSEMTQNQQDELYRTLYKQSWMPRGSSSVQLRTSIKHHWDTSEREKVHKINVDETQITAPKLRENQPLTNSVSSKNTESFEICSSLVVEINLSLHAHILPN